MGIRVIFPNADFSANAVETERIVSIDNLIASDFEIGKRTSISDGSIQSSAWSAVSPILDIPANCAVYLDDISTYNMRVSLYDGDTYCDGQNTTKSLRSFVSPTVNDIARKCRIVIGLQVGDSITEDNVADALTHIRVMKNVNVGSKNIPVVVGGIVSSAAGVDKNQSRAIVGCVQFNGTITATSGMVNMVGFSNSFGAIPENKQDSKSMAKSCTITDEYWYFIGYKNAADTAISSVSEVLNDITFVAE